MVFPPVSVPHLSQKTDRVIFMELLTDTQVQGCQWLKVILVVRRHHLLYADTHFQEQVVIPTARKLLAPLYAAAFHRVVHTVELAFYAGRVNTLMT